MLRLCANLGRLLGNVPFAERFHAAAQAVFSGVEYPSPYHHPTAELRRRLRMRGSSRC